MFVTGSLPLPLCVREGTGTRDGAAGRNQGCRGSSSAGGREWEGKDTSAPACLRLHLPDGAVAVVTPPHAGAGNQVRHGGGGRAAVTGSAWGELVPAAMLWGLGARVPCVSRKEMGTEPPRRQVGFNGVAEGSGLQRAPGARAAPSGARCAGRGVAGGHRAGPRAAPAAAGGGGAGGGGAAAGRAPAGSAAPRPASVTQQGGQLSRVPGGCAEPPAPTPATYLCAGRGSLGG